MTESEASTPEPPLEAVIDANPTHIDREGVVRAG
jgi:hypothetical protein